MYNVGDKVRILPNLNKAEHNKEPILMSQMIAMKGQIVTIKEVYERVHGEYYEIKEDRHNHLWHPDWFVPLKIDKDEAFARLVRGELSEETYNHIIRSDS